MKKSYIYYASGILILAIAISLFFVFSVNSGNISNPKDPTPPNGKFVYENAKKSNLKNVELFNNFGGKNNDVVKFSFAHENGLILVGETQSNSDYFDINLSGKKSVFVMLTNLSLKTEKLAIKNLDEPFNISQVYLNNNNLYIGVNTLNNCIIIHFSLNNFAFNNVVRVNNFNIFNIAMVNNNIFVQGKNESIIKVLKFSETLNPITFNFENSFEDLKNVNMFIINNCPILMVNFNNTFAIYNVEENKEILVFNEAVCLEQKFNNNIYLLIKTNSYFQLVCLNANFEIITTENISENGEGFYLNVLNHSVEVMFKENNVLKVKQFCLHGEFLTEYNLNENINNIKQCKNIFGTTIVNYINLEYNIYTLQPFNSTCNKLFNIPASLNNTILNVLKINESYYVVGNIISTDQFILNNFGANDFYIAKLK